MTLPRDLRFQIQQPQGGVKNRLVGLFPRIGPIPIQVEQLGLSADAFDRADQPAAKTRLAFMGIGKSNAGRGVLKGGKAVKHRNLQWQSCQAAGRNSRRVRQPMFAAGRAYGRRANPAAPDRRAGRGQSGRDPPAPSPPPDWPTLVFTARTDPPRHRPEAASPRPASRGRNNPRPEYPTVPGGSYQPHGGPPEYCRRAPLQAPPGRSSPPPLALPESPARASEIPRYSPPARDRSCEIGR